MLIRTIRVGEIDIHAIIKSIISLGKLSFLLHLRHHVDDKFRAFLKTLGLFDDKGHPKKSWGVFQDKTRQITGRGN